MKKCTLAAVLLVLVPSLRVWAAPDNELGLCGQKRGEPVISLSRTLCYGSCPAYDVVIHADGKTDYLGYKFVSVTGSKIDQIPKSQVDKLIDEFKSSGFFQLKDRYTADITDLSTYTLCFSDGKKEKKIVDYGGSAVGMPEVVTKLEKKVDAVAGTAKYVAR
jgi:hypothetical protein